MKAANIATGLVGAAFVLVLLQAMHKPQQAQPAAPVDDLVTVRQSALACATIDHLARARGSQIAADYAVQRRHCVRLSKGERYVVTTWGIDAVKLRPEQGFFEYWAPRGAVE